MQWAKVKDEKCNRSEFRAGLKMKKYGENKAMKEKIESVAFGDGTADSWIVIINIESTLCCSFVTGKN